MRRRDELVRFFVQPARYVRIGEASEAVTGITQSAAEKLIERGVWLRNREWRKGPDGRRYLDLRAFEKWVESDDDAVERAPRDA